VFLSHQPLNFLQQPKRVVESLTALNHCQRHKPRNKPTLQAKIGIIVHKGEEVSICLSKYFTSKTNDQISIAFGGSLQVTLILVQYTLYFMKLISNFHYFFMEEGGGGEEEKSKPS
jgi:hypothetical protein